MIFTERKPGQNSWFESQSQNFPRLNEGEGVDAYFQRLREYYSGKQQQDLLEGCRAVVEMGIKYQIVAGHFPVDDAAFTSASNEVELAMVEIAGIPFSGFTLKADYYNQSIGSINVAEFASAKVASSLKSDHRKQIHDHYSGSGSMDGCSPLYPLRALAVRLVGRILTSDGKDWMTNQLTDDYIQTQGENAGWYVMNNEETAYNRVKQMADLPIMWENFRLKVLMPIQQDLADAGISPTVASELAQAMKNDLGIERDTD